MAAHRMVRGECERCAMRAHWAGAKDECPTGFMMSVAHRKGPGREAFNARMREIMQERRKRERREREAAALELVTVTEAAE